MYDVAGGAQIFMVSFVGILLGCVASVSCFGYFFGDNTKDTVANEEDATAPDASAETPEEETGAVESDGTNAAGKEEDVCLTRL